MTEKEKEPEFGLEAEFRAMFAERSQDVPVTTSPYGAMRRRILAARRKRRQRIGGAGAALAVAAVGLGVWATASGGPEGAPPATHPASTPASAHSSALAATRYVYDDNKTELPAGPLHDAAEAYVTANYHGSLDGVTVVTTFNQAMQQAAEVSQSQNDIGLAALDPKTGYVKALRGTWDRQVQIADTMKPITLAAAFETGHYTPDSTEPINAAKHPLHMPGSSAPIQFIDAQTRQPRNWPPEHGGGDVIIDGDPYYTLRQAAVEGWNTPFAHLEMASDVGLAKILATATAMGMPKGSPDLSPVMSLTLGTAEESPLTMAAVYGVFADGGVYRAPVMASMVRDAKGAMVWQPDTTGKRVLSAKTTDQITDILHGVLTKGSPAGDPVVRALGARGLDGMPGTGDNNHSAWFIGYSPDLVTSVSMSRQDADGKAQRILGGVDGGTVYGGPVVGPIWGQFASKFSG